MLLVRTMRFVGSGHRRRRSTRIECRFHRTECATLEHSIAIRIGSNIAVGQTIPYIHRDVHRERDRIG